MVNSFTDILIQLFGDVSLLIYYLRTEAPIGNVNVIIRRIEIILRQVVVFRYPNSKYCSTYDEIIANTEKTKQKIDE